MNNKFMMYLSSILLFGNLVCLIADGAWFGAEDLSLMQYLTGMSASQVSGFGVLLLPLGFLTHGFPKLILWDFSFLSGELEIVQWGLSIITIAAIWEMVREFLGTTTSIFGRR